MPRAGLDAGARGRRRGRMADAEGLDAVTLARVAGELGVRAPSLDNHVDGRGGLVRGLAVRGVRELTARCATPRSGARAPTPSPPRRGPIAPTRSAHPALYAAGVAAPAPATPSIRPPPRRSRRRLAVLRAWALDGDDAVHAARAFRSASRLRAVEAAGGFAFPMDLDTSFERLFVTARRKAHYRSMTSRSPRRRAAPRPPRAGGTAAGSASRHSSAVGGAPRQLVGQRVELLAGVRARRGGGGPRRPRRSGRPGRGRAGRAACPARAGPRRRCRAHPAARPDASGTSRDGVTAGGSARRARAARRPPQLGDRASGSSRS